MGADVWDRLVAVVADALGVDPAGVVPASTWLELGADSLARVELALRLEDAFDVRLPDVDDEELGTAGQVAALIKREIGAGAHTET